jgi:hypothetical protein
MDELLQPRSEPYLATQVEDEIPDDELDGVAGGLARIWMGEAPVVDGRGERGPTDART